MYYIAKVIAKKLLFLLEFLTMTKKVIVKSHKVRAQPSSAPPQ